MIKVEDGMVEMYGDYVDLIADVMLSFLALAEHLESNKVPKEVAEHMLKDIQCSNIEGAKVHGFDIDLTAMDKVEWAENFKDLPYKSDYKVEESKDGVSYDNSCVDGNKATIMELSGDALTKFLMGMKEGEEF